MGFFCLTITCHASATENLIHEQISLWAWITVTAGGGHNTVVYSRDGWIMAVWKPNICVCVGLVPERDFCNRVWMLDIFLQENIFLSYRTVFPRIRTELDEDMWFPFLAKTEDGDLILYSGSQLLEAPWRKSLKRTQLSTMQQRRELAGFSSAMCFICPPSPTFTKNAESHVLNLWTSLLTTVWDFKDGNGKTHAPFLV